MRAPVAFFATAVAAALVLAPPPGRADDAPKGPGPDISGRWVDKRKGDLTLDVSRCGDAWCGVIVDAKGACGYRALQMTLRSLHDADGKKHALYNGEFRYREGSELYSARATVPIAADGKTNDLWLGGNPARVPDYSRMMLLNLNFARQGEPSCRADRPVS